MGLLSYQFSLWPQEEVESALFAWFKNTILPWNTEFSNKKIFKFLLGSYVRSGIAKNVYSVLLPALHIYSEFSVNPVENTALHKNKVLFSPKGSFISESGLGPEWFLTCAEVDPLSLREGCQLNCRNASPLWAANCFSTSAYFTWKHTHCNIFHLTGYPSLAPASYCCSRSLSLCNYEKLPFEKSNILPTPSPQVDH